MASAGLQSEPTISKPPSREQDFFAPEPALLLRTALANRGILLTGDALLLRVVAENGLSVHGVLWVIDELDAAGACATSLLVEALRAWQCDSTVLLPQHEISKRLDSLAGRL